MKRKRVLRGITGAALLLAPVIGLMLLGCETDSPQPEVTGVTVSPATASVERSKTQQFTAAVAVKEDADKTVTWSVIGGGTGTAIDATGKLTVANAETATTLTVKATSTFDTTKSGTATVTVTTGTPVVTGVTVTPGTADVPKGSTQQFTAQVAATGGADETVTWDVTGGIAGTTISTNGLLTVALAETATTLTIKATSTQDTTKSGTATVTVKNAETAAVKSVTVSPKTASVVKGETQQFVAAVEVAGGEVQTVNWTVTGGITGTAIGATTGLLSVASTETATTLTIKATSTKDATKSDTAVVTVTAGTVSLVTVTPNSVSVQKGTTQSFTADVSSTGTAVKTVTWSVTGGGTGTAIDTTGKLTVAATETATTLTVKATSTFDTTKSGTATVTVTATPVISASVGNVTVTGTTGTAITDADVTITLTNETLKKAITQGEVLTAWFTGIPVGLAAKAKAATTVGATSVTITLSGTPTAESSAALAISIPVDVLTTSTAALAVTSNANAKFAITAPITGNLSLTITLIDGAVTVTGYTGEIVLHKDTTKGAASVTLTTSGYTGVAWYVDGAVKTGQTGNSITLNAADYTMRSHSVTFQGTKDGIPYSKELPFAVGL